MRYVREFMQRHVVGVSKNASMANAVKLMKASHVALMPVVDDGKLVGIVTKEAVLDDGNSGRKVADIMLEPDLFVEQGTDIETAADLMIRRNASRVPVVNNKRQMLFLGVITASEIVKEMKK